MSLWFILRQSLKGILKDIPKILSDKDYSLKKKLYWSVVNPLFHIEKWRGIRLANTIKLGEDISNFSLEHQGKKEIVY